MNGSYDSVDVLKNIEYQHRKTVDVSSTTYTIAGDLLHEHENVGRVERAVRVLSTYRGVRVHLTNKLPMSPWRS